MKVFNYTSEINASNGYFYPIHLHNEQIHLLANSFIEGLQQSDFITYAAKKSQLKGIELHVVCARNGNLMNPENIEREYTILIHPNWCVQVLDHWKSGNLVPRCEELPTAAERLNEIICEDFIPKINESVDLSENPIFEKNEWAEMRRISSKYLV